MSVALPIPADPLDLRRARDGAWAELNAHVAEVEALRREQYPDPDQADIRTRWEPEQSERPAELRAARDVAVLAVRRHPMMVRAPAEGCWAATDTALFHATRPAPESAAGQLAVPLRSPSPRPASGGGGPWAACAVGSRPGARAPAPGWVPVGPGGVHPM